jgi:hypothetical protein
MNITLEDAETLRYPGSDGLRTKNAVEDKRFMGVSSAFIAVSGVVIIAIGVWFFSHSLLWSAANIRALLLRQTPLGTRSTDVRAFADKHGWLVRNYVWSTGFLKLESSKPNQVIGVTSIEGNLGDFLNMNVTAYWKFDSSNRLIDIWVRKTYDAL